MLPSEYKDLLIIALFLLLLPFQQCIPVQRLPIRIDIDKAGPQRQWPKYLTHSNLFLHFRIHCRYPLRGTYFRLDPSLPEDEYLQCLALSWSRTCFVLPDSGTKQGEKMYHRWPICPTTAVCQSAVWMAAGFVLLQTKAIQCPEKQRYEDIMVVPAS